LIAGLGIPYTISAPVAFMENIVAPWSIGGLRQGTQALAMPPKRVFQLVAPADIGAFVAALVERREQVFGNRFDFAGDELSGEEQAKILSHAIGRRILVLLTSRPINYQEIPIAAQTRAPSLQNCASGPPNNPYAMRRYRRRSRCDRTIRT
jgi:uncharacterized protein YbjT (DUF2867 family)